jgi:hypothetical protein
MSPRAAVRAIIVIELTLDPVRAAQQIVESMKAIDPPKVPHFTRDVHVAVDGFNGENVATYVVDYLKGETPADVAASERDWG